MLRLTRRHVKPTGRLLFSVFIDDPGEPSQFEAVVQAALSSDDPAVRASAEARLAEALQHRNEGYWDAVPEQPLLQARYTRAHALELIEGTGWDVVSVHPREQHIQHHIVCAPV